MAKFISLANLKTFKDALWAKIQAAFVAKEDGKGLSSNDYTTAEKTKLAGLNNYNLPTASADTLGGIKVGSGLTMDDKTGILSANGVQVDLSPYAKTADVEAGYVSKTGYVAFSQAEKDKLAGLFNYSLPQATDKVLGGVKIGSGVTVSDDGTISVAAPNLSAYLTSAAAEATYLKIADMQEATEAEINAIWDEA